MNEQLGPFIVVPPKEEEADAVFAWPEEVSTNTQAEPRKCPDANRDGEMGRVCLTEESTRTNDDRSNNRKHFGRRVPPLNGRQAKAEHQVTGRAVAMPLAP